MPNTASSMLRFYFVLISFLVMFTDNVKCKAAKDEGEFLYPTVLIAMLARNKAHTLPYFFAYLERLDYPRDRLALWLRSDNSIDDTVNIIKTWMDKHKDEYHHTDIVLDDSVATDGSLVFEWPLSRFNHIIRLKEEALEGARKMWADYVFFLDCDVFLVNNQTLKLLVEEEKAIIAPVMETLGAYSNFWCGMNEQGYYKRTEDYLPILDRQKIGCFEVPMVHSCFLVNLRHRDSIHLSFDPKKIKDYSGPVDDIIVFAYSSRAAGLKMFVLNRESFGYMLQPMEKANTLHDDKEQLTNLKMEIMVDYPEVYISKELSHFLPKKEPDTMGFDMVYLINLERRPTRRERMLNTLSEMGVEAQVFTAVDGQTLNDSYIKELGIKMLPAYKDPYHKRPITKGEIGCFLSHYYLWRDMIEKQHRTAIVFEDDLRFEPYFRKKVQSLLKEIQKIGLLWDLIYLGRKRLSESNEPYVEGTSNLVKVDYSYWTLCYLITMEGAKKLVSSNPLSKLVPVDEFLPIMFDRHPEDEWKSYFPKRNLRAYSVHPLLAYPTHYTGEENYISDTEDSDIALSVVKEEL